MEQLTVVQAIRKAFPDVPMSELKALTPQERRDLAQYAAQEMGFALVEGTTSP